MTCSSGVSRRQRVNSIKSPWRELMKRRSLASRLPILAVCVFVLAGVGSVVGAAPAAAETNFGSLTEANIGGLKHDAAFTCGCEPTFTIEKRQEIAGSGSGFTTDPLVGEIGQTVDYEIIVTNTSEFVETFTDFTDPHCDEGTIAGGPGAALVAPGESTTYTCSQLLDAYGVYTNEATVTGNALSGMSLTKTANQVVVEVPKPPPPPPAPGFKIEKLQEIAGSNAGFTTSPLTGAFGQTVDYEIIVTNTGNVALALTGFADKYCDASTLSGGLGEALLAPGASTTYTCTRALAGEGKFFNEAELTGTPPGGTPITHQSNQVIVEVPPAAKVAPAAQIAPPVSSPELPKIAVKCFFAVKPILRGASGTKRKPFTVRVAGIGELKQVSLYLDGRKLNTLRHAQLKSGRFSVRIDPHRLRYGAHRVLV